MARASIPEKESGGGEVDDAREENDQLSASPFLLRMMTLLTSGLKKGCEPPHKSEEESMESRRGGEGQDGVEGREETDATRLNSPTDCARQNVLSEGSGVLPVSLDIERERFRVSRGRRKVRRRRVERKKRELTKPIRSPEGPPPRSTASPPMMRPRMSEILIMANQNSDSPNQRT